MSLNIIDIYLGGKIMSDFYDYGARNGLSIVTDSGQVTQIKFVDNNNKTVILKRGIADSKSFLSTL